MANSKKATKVEDVSSGNVGTFEIVESYKDEIESCDVAQPAKKDFKSKFWIVIEKEDANTYVMNVPFGCIVRTESENGSSMCFVPNMRYDDGFRRTV